ncbi:MAG: DNA mismatch repair protein MutS [Candidatus Eisenbacteria sp.]|nr:DNA mismatch repair protein MutS [Candidatus Eisenbacteria bacterium]
MKPTPVMSQYLRLKEEAGDAILFFRMGDFYEMFMDDAVEVAALLDLTLTSRDKNAAEPIPMAGVPWHSAGPYIERLLRRGRRVALCEQIDRPGGGGLMEREIVEILTPGTATPTDLDEAASNVFLAALCAGRGGWGLARADISTGEVHVGELPAEEALIELERLPPRELLLPRSLAETAELAHFVREHASLFVTSLDEWHFSPSRGRETLAEHYGVATLEPFGLDDMDAGLAAAGALFAYARDSRRAPLKHLRPPRAIRAEEGMLIDEATLRNLEILEPLSGQRQHTLLHVLDATVTAMGGRALRRALSRPECDLERIRGRHAGTATLLDDPGNHGELQQQLRGVADVERLLGRLHCGRARATDLGRLRDSLGRLPAISAAVSALQAVGRFPGAAIPDALAALHAKLAGALVETAQLGGERDPIRDGYDAELDESRRLLREGEAWIAALQKREREETGIPSLKVGHNKVFGYYLEATRAHLSRIPSRYERKQTLVGGERFVTPELKAWEEKIGAAQGRCAQRHTELLEELRALVVAETAGLQAVAAAIAEWDLLVAFAARAREYHYTRPEIDEGDGILIRGGRHPVVERFLEAESFVPNDVELNGRGRQIQIITGPNMAGKSTFLRQIGCIVVMAQAGSYVPAAEARIGLLDRLYTRVGASDNIARGQSTFLVEMVETSRILHGATSRSLVLLDEIGRGTSTFDGLAIAWAVAEHLRGDPLCRPRTLFATHFHELTALGRAREGYVNLNVLVKEWKDQVVFVRRVVEGAADRSYGIQVARLAGLPESLLGRAREVLRSLERQGPQGGREGGGGAQMPLFAELAATAPGVPKRGSAPAAGEELPVPGSEMLPGGLTREGIEGLRALRDALDQLDLDAVTGLEALQWLYFWQRGGSASGPGSEGARGAAAVGGTLGDAVHAPREAPERPEGER